MVAHEEPNKLRVIVYSSLPHEATAFEQELKDTPDADTLDLVFVSAKLDEHTIELASGAGAVCLFARDRADARLLSRLHTLKVGLVAMRYAGISSVNLSKATELGIQVARAPAHAPTSIAEYTISLILALSRKVFLAHSRTRDGNLTMQGLLGGDIRNKTVGIIGTGKVGTIVARILRGFQCKVLAYDMFESKEVTDVGGRYVLLPKLLQDCDILSLHAPLVWGTRHMIGRATLPRCKTGVQIVSTARGGLLDIKAVIEGLRSGQVGGLAIDVYEGESSLFKKDPTGEMINEDFQVLQSMPNVVIAGHLAALTTNAFASVARSTIHSLLQFHKGEEMDYAISPGQTRPKIGRQG